jgi:hypothetical protein
MLEEWYVAKHSEGSNRGPVKVLSRYSPGETDEKHKNLSQDILWSGRYSNGAPPQYETRALQVSLFIQ